MFSFLFRNLSSSWIRTISILFASFLSACILVVFYFSYINVREGITYYTLEGIDEKRFTITKSATLFQLLDRSIGGIDPIMQQKVEHDPHISRYKEFHFIDVPVLGTFHLFNFGLQIDIPTFTITDSQVPFDGIGISSSMIRYYNLEFAGTNVMFPTFTPDNIIGKKVSLQFGASKLFNLSGSVSQPIDSTITHIEPDFPGFGVVVATELARQKMADLGMPLNPPYKIVAYMRDVADRPAIESAYAGAILEFDADTIRDQETTFFTIGKGFVILGLGVIGIVYAFLFLLFLAYFREKDYAYNLIARYKIDWKGRILLLLLEPMILLVFASIIGCVIGLLFQDSMVSMLQRVLSVNGILFPLLHIPIDTLLLLFLANFVSCLILLILSYHKQKNI